MLTQLDVIRALTEAGHKESVCRRAINDSIALPGFYWMVAAEGLILVEHLNPAATPEERDRALDAYTETLSTAGYRVRRYEQILWITGARKEN